MQQWLERLKELLPLFTSFYLCFLLLQVTFIFQHHPSAWLLTLVYSMSYLASGIGVFWMLCAGITIICPISFHAWIRWSFFSLLYFGLIGTLVCDQYVLLTHERLDEAIFLFDWNEIWMIADPVHRLTWPFIVGGGILLVLPFLLNRPFFHTLNQTRWIFGITLALNIVRFIPNATESSRISENRFIFFVSRSVKLLIQPRQTNQVALRSFNDLDPSLYGNHAPLDPRFPLAHTIETPSLLAHFFRKTSNHKPPNIKIIIVESMSADLFGQRAANTGNLMPFMDSLSKKSLYFPNGFSTYQRTHNVLPAVLASVPNTMDGNVFQQLPFPRHYALFNLFQNHYFTQFYCGVPLEYLNMIGLMSHYQTDYHVSKWDNKHKIHKALIGNAWGFPDEDLFQQAQSDDSMRFNQLDKSSMSVFLTISSHDPFIYPNKLDWGARVKQKAALIKDPKLRALVSTQSASFGSFCYVDSTLKSFFDLERRKPSFKNTVYIITGDHGTELYPRNPLSKYNIPIVIYSTLLKKPQTSQAIVSHNDIAPTLVNYLKSVYKLQTPDTLSFVGTELMMSKQFKPHRNLVFTTNKLKTTDMLHQYHAWISGKYYVVDSTLSIREVSKKASTDWIKKQLHLYQLFSQYTIVQNNLIDSASFSHWMGRQDVFKLDKKIKYAVLALRPQMTLLGTYMIPNKNRSIRVQVSAQMKLSSKNQLKKGVALFIHAKKNKYLSEKWTVFSNIRGRIDGTFKRNRWNNVVFSLEFNPTALKYWKKGGRLYTYFRIPNDKKIMIKEVLLRYYHSQQKNY
ncbi:MAG: LTA synthase family protein [Flavobacteriales bacterium]